MLGGGSHAAARSGQAQGSGATYLKLSRAEKHRMVDELSAFDIFAHCTRDDIGALVEAGSPFTLPADWALMAEGAAAESFYAITTGQVRIFHGRVQVAEVGAGSVVGEMGLLSGGPRQATVTSSCRLAGLRVSNEYVTDLFAQHPSLLGALRTAYEARLAAERQALL